MSAEDEKKDAPETTAKPDAAKKPAAKKPAATKKAETKAASKAGSGDGETKAAAKKAAGSKKAASAKKAPSAKASESSEEPSSGKKAPAAKATAPAKEATESETKSAAKPAPSSKAAPARRRVVRAHARYVRTSARKARMVCGHIRGKSVEEARAILAFTPREVARDWSKLLESAVANAESNHELLEDDLIVREAYADEGPTIKRFRPRAMGRATPIRKRTSHLTITLTPDAEPRTTKRRKS